MFDKLQETLGGKMFVPEGTSKTDAQILFDFLLLESAWAGTQDVFGDKAAPEQAIEIWKVLKQQIKIVLDHPHLG